MFSYFLEKGSVICEVRGKILCYAPKMYLTSVLNLKKGGSMKYLFLTLTTLVLLAGCVSNESGFPHAAYVGLYTSIHENPTKAPVQVKTSVGVETVDWDGFDMVPIALIGSDTMPLNFNHSYPPYEFHYYKDSTNYHLRDTVKIKIVYNDGSITGALTIPDTFKITTPISDTGVISKNASYTVAWNAANGADYYWLGFHLTYEYYDTLGYHGVQIDTSFPTKGTSYTFPSDYLFPQNVDSVDWAYGSFSVTACSGPMMWPGEMINNMDGTGKGYYTAETSDPRNQKYIKIEGSSYKAQEISNESSYEHTMKMIERMKKITGGDSPSLSRN